MAAVVAGLKARLAEITAIVQELRAEIAALEGQKTAFETVIRSYDPTYLLHNQPNPNGNRSLFLAAVLSVFLLVGLAEDTTDVLSVDLDPPLQLHGVAAQANSLPELLQQYVGRLILDVELSGQMGGCHALHRGDLLPGRHGDLLDNSFLFANTVPVVTENSWRHSEAELRKRRRRMS